METPTLIYCAGGNKRYADIAIKAGFKFGSQFPDTVYHPVYFSDQDWKNPNKDLYFKYIEEYRPHMATVLDWEEEEQFEEVIEWANKMAEFVQVVIIIPKVAGGIPRIPRTIKGKEVRLGYSVPTRYAGTKVPVGEFQGWPVHLLGGSPHKQMELVNKMDVRSADGNMANKMASMRCQLWVPGTAKGARNRWWPTLNEAGIQVEKDAPYEAFRLSCKNIMAAWLELSDREG